MKKLAGVFFIFILLASCTASKKLASGTSINRLRLVGEYLLPGHTHFGGTLVGGLSGIDYSAKEDLYYFISDDRSDHNPARFYTAKIFLSNQGIDSVRWTSTSPLRLKNGAVYPNKTEDSLHVPDPEALRVNERTGGIVWSSEGERIVRRGSVILQNPSINVMRSDGLLTDTFALPPNLLVHSTEKGPRRNGVLEGLAFADDFKTLYASVEEPLYEDGPRADTKNGGWIRILKYDAATKNQLAQYAYPIDPVVEEPVAKDSFIVNGVVDILAVDDHRLLVTERSFSYGYVGCNVRVYEVDVNEAEDVSDNASLSQTPPQKFLQKKLLMNMDALGLEVYNIEGATLGPLLPNGKRSLLFVADDNFSGKEKTQLLLFEVE